jgi:uncharacterized membrane protein (DUF4010 family)
VISPRLAARAVAVAVASNIVAKAVYAAVLGSRAHAWPVGLGSALALLAALAGLVLTER